MQNSLQGTKIDNKFLLQQILGEGGLGVVYKAKQDELSRYVAIKILHQHCLSAEDNRTRFDREAKILSTLQHPNIVSIYSYGDSDELCYIAMEYLEGKTLTQRINEGLGTDWKKSVEIVIQLCDALDYAH
ncbi:MAG: serine/threonine protein kinase, partial [Candidatus Obscuribacterales bacterium]|nr:serine/threonine protein kinase [Candidatus Obscuribacterales bacterium]